MESFSEQRLPTGPEAIEQTREKVVASLRENPGDLSPMVEFLNRREENFPKIRSANIEFLESAVMQTEIYEEAGLAEAARTSREADLVIIENLEYGYARQNN